MKCSNCGVEGHESQGDSDLCWIAVKDRCQRLEKALEEIAELPDSDYQDDGRTHQELAKEAIGFMEATMEKCYCGRPMEKHTIRLLHGWAVAGSDDGEVGWVPCLKAATDGRTCVDSLHTGVQMHPECKDSGADKDKWCAYCVLLVADLKAIF